MLVTFLGGTVAVQMHTTLTFYQMPQTGNHSVIELENVLMRLFALLGKLCRTGAAAHRRRLADVRQARGQPKEARHTRPTARPAGDPGAGGAAATARRSAATVPHAAQDFAPASPAAQRK